MPKRIIFDISTSENFGPSCKFVELVKPYIDKGYDVDFWEKNWKDKSDPGLVYDDESKTYLRSKIKFNMKTLLSL